MDYRISEVWDMRYLRPSRAIWGPGLEVDSEAILDPFWTHSQTHPEKPHKLVIKPLHLAVGRALRLEYE